MLNKKIKELDNQIFIISDKHIKYTKEITKLDCKYLLINKNSFSFFFWHLITIKFSISELTVLQKKLCFYINNKCLLVLFIKTRR